MSSTSYLDKPGFRQRQLVSVVVPFFNEAAVIEACYSRLKRIADSEPFRFELLFVDDGSSDKSADIVRRIRGRDSRVVLLSLSRNFGKESALTAGLLHAKGDAVIVIDADLQDPPELIPSMLAAWAKGAHVVCMRRRKRAGESWVKKTLAHCFYRVLNQLSEVDIPEDVGDFRLMSRQALEAVNALPERNRYMKGIFAWIGFSPVFLDYDRDPRFAGDSKWRLAGLFQLAFEGITSFSIAPLKWMMCLGLLTALGGFAYGFWIVGKALVIGDPVAGYPSLVALLTFIGGVTGFFHWLARRLRWENLH